MTDDKGFERLVKLALAGERAPFGGQLPPGTIKRLCKSGHIRSEVYMHNFRVITILVGEHAGARTQEPPARKNGAPNRPYVVSDVKGTFRNGVLLTNNSSDRFSSPERRARRTPVTLAFKDGKRQ